MIAIIVLSVVSLLEAVMIVFLAIRVCDLLNMVDANRFLIRRLRRFL